MIKSKMIDLLKLRLGSREDSDMDALITAEAGQVQIELEQGPFQPWFLYQEKTVATVAGTRTVTMPEGFLGFNPDDDDYSVTYLTDAGVYQPIIVDTKDRLENFYGVDAGPPAHYMMPKETLYLFPLPDAVYTLRLSGFYSDTPFDEVADDEENEWLRLAGDWLLAKTGARIARYIKDKDASAAFMLDEQSAYNRVYTRHTIWLEASRNRILGGI